MSELTVRAYAEQRHFNEGTLDRWLRRPAADRQALLRVADDLRLGENHVRDLLDALEAIAARRGCGFAEILEEALAGRSRARSGGRNERLRHLKLALRRLRFPQLTTVEQRLHRLIKELRLPAGVVMVLPENLEGEELTVIVHAASASQLRRRLDQAALQLRGAEIDELFRVFGGEW